MSFYLSMEHLEKLCRKCTTEGNKDCLMPRGVDTGCRKFIAALVEELPIERKANSQGREFYYIGGDDTICGIPADLLDKYTNQIVDRLRKVRDDVQTKHFLRWEDHSRPIYTVDELEEERRALHIAVLHSAGLMSLDCSPDAVALKIVVERFVEQRCHDFGVIP